MTMATLRLMVDGQVGKVLVSAGSVVRPDVARRAREAVAVASDPCVGSYIANGGYSWAQTAPALASISPIRALPPEREWPAKRHPADALPFGMQYCLRKLRGPAVNENSCGRRSRLNSRGFARRPKETHARCGHIGGLKLRSDDGGRCEPSGY